MVADVLYSFATQAHVNGGREDGQTDWNRIGRNHDLNNNPPGNGGPPPGGDHFDDDDETQARLNAARNAARLNTYLNTFGT